MSSYRDGIHGDSYAQPRKAFEASDRHLGFVEETLLDLDQEHNRRERLL